MAKNLPSTDPVEPTEPAKPVKPDAPVMHLPTPTRLFIETNDPRGLSIVFAPEWPGACGWGPSLVAALDRLKPDLLWTRTWLVRHGFTVPDVDPACWSVVQQVPATGDSAIECDSEGFFAWDEAPATAGEIARCASLLHASRADFLALVDPLPDRVCSFRLTAGKRTIAEIIDHIAIAEWWYSTRLMPDPRQARDWQKYGASPRERWQHIRTMFTREFLPGLTARIENAAEAEAVFVHRSESWSARKVLRRAVWHELLHYKQLVRLVPKVLAAVEKQGY